MTDREHAFFILGYAKGDMNVIALYIEVVGISQELIVECSKILAEERSKVPERIANLKNK